MGATPVVPRRRRQRSGMRSAYRHPQAIPLGTDRVAIALLGKKTLNCRGAGPVNCRTLSANVFGDRQWIIDLEFDGEERLSFLP